MKKRRAEMEKGRETAPVPQAAAERALGDGVLFFLFLVFLAALLVSLALGAFHRVPALLAAALCPLLPHLLRRWLGLLLPSALILLGSFLLFSSVLLGEMGSWYLRYPVWDSVLHAVSGMLFAALGFAVPLYCGVDRVKAPFFVALFAALFSMGVGVLWELFEFLCDALLSLDMQKDHIVFRVNSLLFLENPLRVDPIYETTVTSSDGTRYVMEGYLDIGLFDTVKDLAVGAVGAFLFSAVGYLCLRYLPRHRLTGILLPARRGRSE